MKKIIFTVLTLIIISASSLQTFAVTPPGPSGLNYLALDSQNLYTQVVITERVWLDNNTFRDDEFGSGVYQRYYSQAAGSMDITAGLPQRKVGDKVYLQMNTGGNLIFRHITPGQKYYAGAVLFWNQEGDPVTYRVMATKITFTTIDDRVYELRPTEGNSNLPQDSQEVAIKEIDIEWDIPEGVPSTNINNCYMQWLQLLQERPIDPSYLSGSMTATGFTPFNDSYFASAQSYGQGYNSGYEAGYHDGAAETSGGAVQNWSTFIFRAVNGFMSFEIMPGFTLWGLFAVLIGLPLLMWFLKVFLGG